MTEVASSQASYRFGDKSYRSIGTLHIRMPVTEMCFVDAYLDIVEADVPFLLGLNILTQLKAHLDFDEDTMSPKFEGWSLPLTRKLGHVYNVWEAPILYTEAELRKIHRHFHHPQSKKLAAFIKRAAPESYSPAVLSDPERTQEVCDVCQREADGPHRFRVSLPYEECIFNRALSMDLMKVDGRTVFHIMNKDTIWDGLFLRRPINLKCLGGVPDDMGLTLRWIS